jgi:hypothetical protein
MDPSTFAHEKDLERPVYVKHDVDIEAFREYTVVAALLVFAALFLITRLVSNLVYYRTGPHGRMRKFLLELNKRRAD